jgi:hypothetical protein
MGGPVTLREGCGSAPNDCSWDEYSEENFNRTLDSTKLTQSALHRPTMTDASCPDFVGPLTKKDQEKADKNECTANIRFAKADLRWSDEALDRVMKEHDNLAKIARDPASTQTVILAARDKLDQAIKQYDDATRKTESDWHQAGSEQKTEAGRADMEVRKIVAGEARENAYSLRREIELASFQKGTSGP